MFESIKSFLYFPLASYFAFFSKIKLSRWNPKVIIVTGSVGKTSLFELAKSQIGNYAYFAEHVNSSFGIPANILGLRMDNVSHLTWVSLIMAAPFKIFTKVPNQKIYIVEADCDRPNEGKFLAKLLKPNVTIWISSAITHSANFDKLVPQKFQNAQKAVAYEFGYFIQNTSDLVIANCDSKTIEEELVRTKAKIIKITKDKYLKGYKITEKGSELEIRNQKYTFPFVLPEAFYFSIAAVTELSRYLSIDFDSSFKKFEIPKGRGSLFAGINNSIVIDSSYNASKKSVIELLDTAYLLKKAVARKLVFLFGDMRELGSETEEEHKEVAYKISSTVDELYCVGPLTKRYVIPNVNSNLKTKWFENSLEAGKFLKEHLIKNSIVLAKASQNELFLEEAIKFILKNKSDEKKLCRQEPQWILAKNKFFKRFS